MTTRLGKSRYSIYNFPKEKVIQSWSDALYTELSNNADKFNTWERNFIIDIALKLKCGAKLSEETVFKLETVYAAKT